MNRETELITVIYVDENGVIEVKEIENSLEAKQELVKGYIECVDISEGISLICNEEGKCMRMDITALLMSDDEVADVICGPFIIAGVDYESGEFASLTYEQIDSCTDMLEEFTAAVVSGHLIVARTVRMEDSDL